MIAILAESPAHLPCILWQSWRSVVGRWTGSSVAAACSIRAEAAAAE